MKRFMLRVREKGPSSEQSGTIREIEAGKIICLAQNYPKHAAEMKSTPPKLPYFFLKPTT